MLKTTALFTSLSLICLTAFSQEEFKNYTQKIPGSDQSYDLVAIPGGEFLMGSPKKEKGRREDEGPQHKVKIEPFWMGKVEVTWDIYDLYSFKSMETEFAQRFPDETNSVAKTDGSTRPSPPYVDMSFGMGRTGYPAIGVTQYAAIHFCKWLYEKTGIFYRLPTEAEWEYAALAYIGNNPNTRKSEKKRGEELITNKQVYAWNNNFNGLRENRRNAWQGEMLANFKRGSGDLMGVAGGLNDRAATTAEVESYFPNSC